MTQPTREQLVQWADEKATREENGAWCVGCTEPRGAYRAIARLLRAEVSGNADAQDTSPAPPAARSAPPTEEGGPQAGEATGGTTMTGRDRRALVEAKICLEFALDISVETVKRGHARDAHAILAVLLERWQRETGFPPPVPGADPEPVQRPPRASLDHDALVQIVANDMRVFGAAGVLCQVLGIKPEEEAGDDR